ncbi:glycerol-3-phosphate 1-O-acyltransferase PlsY [uncultured Fretibacterium sp.]|uniref:glycerol-3-phosphate 1-O-acyltransferase PlsY n=1 Tax=uncultured Fretibacterium sp. TaxID=1678694 RepID=UPI0026151D29|nr:glycerol-3-phosphate 1-O-acyltransferase PlsY [uncultured Fretibacterium sp.]
MRVAMFWMFVSYFIGSLPTGYLVARIFRGVDIRTVGSGSIGATNVRRLMGQGWAVFVTLVDMLKGALALLLTVESASSDPWLLSLSALAAVLGHNYPVWLRFRGGKGVATTYGTMFFIWPYNSFAIVLMSGALWYAVMTSTRYVSLASMVSLLALPAFFWMLDAPLPFILLALLLALLAMFRHRSNVSRLLEGRENPV